METLTFRVEEILNNTIFNERLSLIDSYYGVKEKQKANLAFLMAIQVFSSLTKEKKEKKANLLGKVWNYH